MINTFFQQDAYLATSTSGSGGSFTKMANETLSDQKDACSISLLHDTDLIESALNTVCKVKNSRVQNQAIDLLSTFREIINSLQNHGVELTHLPPLWAVELEDGSILLEWVFQDFRVGFGIDPDSEKSSWYLVSNKKLDEVSASGYLTKGNYVATAIRLFSFILSNS